MKNEYPNFPVICFGGLNLQRALQIKVLGGKRVPEQHVELMHNLHNKFFVRENLTSGTLLS